MSMGPATPTGGHALYDRLRAIGAQACKLGGVVSALRRERPQDNAFLNIEVTYIGSKGVTCRLGGGLFGQVTSTAYLQSENSLPTLLRQYRETGETVAGVVGFETPNGGRIVVVGVGQPPDAIQTIVENVLEELRAAVAKLFQDQAATA